MSAHELFTLISIGCIDVKFVLLRWTFSRWNNAGSKPLSPHLEDQLQSCGSAVYRLDCAICQNSQKIATHELNEKVQVSRQCCGRKMRGQQLGGNTCGIKCPQKPQALCTPQTFESQHKDSQAWKTAAISVDRFNSNSSEDDQFESSTYRVTIVILGRSPQWHIWHLGIAEMRLGTTCPAQTLEAASDSAFIEDRYDSIKLDHNVWLADIWQF